jgi:DnaK suppressor protein
MNNVTTKAVKTAKPVKKAAGETGRASGAVAKKTAVAKTKATTGASVNKSKSSAKTLVKDAGKKTAAKPVKSTQPAKPTQSVKPAQKPQAVPTAKKSKAASSIAPPAAKPAAVKPKTKSGAAQQIRSKADIAPRATLAAPRYPAVPARPPVAARPIPIKKDPRLANNWKIKPVEQWTDAEVICMPDEEYMKDKQLAFFRLKLLQLKNDILANAGETTEHLRSDTVVVPDPADRATIEEEHALELRTRDRERKLLRKIEQSIARIDTGDYGYCDETGEPIGVARLLARPTATLSLEAQQRRELKQKLFGD